MQHDHKNQLRKKYGIDELPSSQCEVDAILTALEQHERLTEQDVHFLQKHKVLSEVLWIKYHEIEANFYRSEYQKENNLYHLLQEIDHLEALEKLHFTIVNRLRQKIKQYWEIIEIQETKRKQRCQKYGISEAAASQHEIDTLLAKLDEEARLTTPEIEYLKQHNSWTPRMQKDYYLIEARHYELQYQQSGEEIDLAKAAIYWHDSGDFQAAWKCAKHLDPDRFSEDGIKSRVLSIRCQQLSGEYAISYLKEREKQIFPILRKLEQRTRLADRDVQWLKQHNAWSLLIQNAYHDIEAAYYESQYQHDHDPANLVQAAMHYQEKGNARKAFQLTKQVDIDALPDEKLKMFLIGIRYERLSRKWNVFCPKGAEKTFCLIMQKLEQRIRLADADMQWLLQHNSRTSLIQNAYHDIEAAYYESQYQHDHDPANLVQAAMHYQERGDALKAFQLTEQVDIDALPDDKLKMFLISLRCVPLSKKWGVACPKGAEKEFYLIIQKLEQRTRLTAQNYTWLHEKRLLSPSILKTYHEIEATWYETQFRQQKKKNYWNAVNASSHWRGAEEPEKALELTANLPFEEIKENKLKSALLTTRGGAFRDIGSLKEAEECADQAREFNPESYQPYTLKGAICYDLKKFIDGDYWFEEAIKRGATPRDVDAELRSVIKRITNDEERESIITHLLKKDPNRYAWAKKFRKNSSAKEPKQQPASPAKNKAQKATTKK
ncbi:hypothetical protein U27_03724 [Candidatus Vecturithrix granuli]|uniref:Uncharacterized protein n=1 Tax=Vecturithrix granuli TaxID=1499967 RepID=A0A081BWQ5_VECG1|nr:hypothetical protein U27_03724 [Candidatus Vecturithrix granuli]